MARFPEQKFIHHKGKGSRPMLGTKQRRKKVEQKKHLTRKEAILAHCYDCMGFYADGYTDCKNTECMLYDWMPKRKCNNNEKKR